MSQPTALKALKAENVRLRLSTKQRSLNESAWEEIRDLYESGAELEELASGVGLAVKTVREGLNRRGVDTSHDRDITPERKATRSPTAVRTCLGVEEDGLGT